MIAYIPYDSSYPFVPEFTIIPAFGVYMHLIGDSISCGDGMMWRHGWKREQYGRYINLFSATFKFSSEFKFPIVFGKVVNLLKVKYNSLMEVKFSIDSGIFISLLNDKSTITL